MARSGRVCLNMMLVLLMHSQSETSFFDISFSFKGLTLIETNIFSSCGLEPIPPSMSPCIVSSSLLILSQFIQNSLTSKVDSSKHQKKEGNVDRNRGWFSQPKKKKRISRRRKRERERRAKNVGTKKKKKPRKMKSCKMSHVVCVAEFGFKKTQMEIRKGWFLRSLVFDTRISADL